MKFLHLHHYPALLCGIILVGATTLTPAEKLKQPIQAAEVSTATQPRPAKVNLIAFVDGKSQTIRQTALKIEPTAAQNVVIAQVPKLDGYTSYINQKIGTTLKFIVQANGELQQLERLEYRKTVTDDQAVTKDAQITVSKDGAAFELIIPSVTALPGGPSVFVAAPQLDGYSTSLDATGLELRLLPDLTWELITPNVTYTRQPVTSDASLTVQVDGQARQVTLLHLTAIPGGPAITVPAPTLEGYTSDKTTWQLKLSADGQWFAEDTLSYSKDPVIQQPAETTESAEQKDKNVNNQRVASLPETAAKPVLTQTAAKLISKQKPTRSGLTAKLTQSADPAQILQTPSRQNTISTKTKPVQKQTVVNPKTAPKNDADETALFTKVAGICAALIGIVSLGIYKFH
ncbi:hypothetical protein LFYK43_20030 [Ligilactobacillus salitolerans]|uniref:Uncharacterized protein n=1 Tax=Ligilactobacillus salitolerans TaxID=1808352 RepID=A0A401IVI0_9LACO|nr:hypothetical protein [Ligilactobacillus salitolerans]GBG95544.1 hypothetical protein LFYK43_20030 [Ligilactobacillus salitolerans]